MTLRLRVLHCLTTFVSSSGAAENTRITLRLLSRDRHEVFLATRPGQSMELDMPSDVTLLPAPRLVRPVNPWADARTLLDLVAMCRRYRFDVVHTHNSKDGIIGRWAAHLAGVPAVVHTTHLVSFRASRFEAVNALYTGIERRTARITDRILAVSKENVRDYLARGIGRPDQFRVVYSGLEMERYDLGGIAPAEARAQLGLPEGGPWIGWFGRFNHQKDPLTFVRAADLIARAMPGARFVVCGDDPLGQGLWPQIAALVSELGLDSRIHFLGFRPDLPLVMRAVDVVLHSSRYEGMGRIVCEALASDRPVVATDVDGVREVIVSGERGGFLAPPGQPGALAERALRLIADPVLSRSLAAAGRVWVAAHLSARKMVEDIEAVYAELLHPSTPSPTI